jgi:hypothetical protein
MGFEFHLCFRFNNNTIRLAVGKKALGPDPGIGERVQLIIERAKFFTEHRAIDRL